MTTESDLNVGERRAQALCGSAAKWALEMQNQLAQAAPAERAALAMTALRAWGQLAVVHFPELKIAFDKSGGS